MEVSSEDLVIKMISILRDVDTSFILSEVKLTYVQELEQSKQDVESLVDKFKSTDPALVDLLKKMLEFNPYMRPSAKDLLRESIFDHIRLP